MEWKTYFQFSLARSESHKHKVIMADYVIFQFSLARSVQENRSYVARIGALDVFQFSLARSAAQPTCKRLRCYHLSILSCEIRIVLPCLPYIQKGRPFNSLLRDQLYDHEKRNSENERSFNSLLRDQLHSWGLRIPYMHIHLSILSCEIRNFIYAQTSKLSHLELSILSCEISLSQEAEGMNADKLSILSCEISLMVANFSFVALRPFNSLLRDQKAWTIDVWGVKGFRPFNSLLRDQGQFLLFCLLHSWLSILSCEIRGLATPASETSTWLSILSCEIS